MKVGFLQMEPMLGESPNNALQARILIDKAGDFDLLVMPELANSGYNFKDKDHAFQHAEDITKSHFLDILQKICSRRNCHIVTGFNEREGDHAFNSALLINKDGVVGKYQKIHLFNREQEYFRRGDYLSQVYQIGDAKVGMLVCYDWAFPEVWRLLALKGADIIAHPANLIVRGGATKAVPAHARVNSFYVVTANRIGVETDLQFTGGSTIVDPEGCTLAEASEDQEEIMIVDIDIEKARDKNITPNNHLLNDRRPELYKGLC